MPPASVCHGRLVRWQNYPSRLFNSLETYLKKMAQCLMLIFPCSQSSRKKSAHKKVLLNLPWLLLAYCTMRRCWKRMAKSWATQLAADDEMMMPRIDPFNNRFTKWSIDARNRSEVRKYIRTCWKINSLVLWWHYWKHHLHPPAPFENHPKKQWKTHENTEGGHGACGRSKCGTLRKIGIEAWRSDTWKMFVRWNMKFLEAHRICEIG